MSPEEESYATQQKLSSINPPPSKNRDVAPQRKIRRGAKTFHQRKMGVAKNETGRRQIFDKRPPGLMFVKESR